MVKVIGGEILGEIREWNECLDVSALLILQIFEEAKCALFG